MSKGASWTSALKSLASYQRLTSCSWPHTIAAIERAFITLSKIELCLGMSLEIWSALSRKVMHVVLVSVIMDANSRPFPRPCLEFSSTACWNCKNCGRWLLSLQHLLWKSFHDQLNSSSYSNISNRHCSPGVNAVWGSVSYCLDTKAIVFWTSNWKSTFSWMLLKAIGFSCRSFSVIYQLPWSRRTRYENTCLRSTLSCRRS